MRESSQEQSPVKPLEVPRVLVVEDFDKFRRLLCSLLQDRTDCRIVGEASDGLEAIQKVEELRPDLILLDIGLPTLNGIKVAERVRTMVPHAKVLFISHESSSDIIEETFQVGGQGYIHKARVQIDLLPAIEAARRGEIFVSERP